MTFQGARHVLRKAIDQSRQDGPRRRKKRNSSRPSRHRLALIALGGLAIVAVAIAGAAWLVQAAPALILGEAGPVPTPSAVATSQTPLLAVAERIAATHNAHLLAIQFIVFIVQLVGAVIICGGLLYTVRTYRLSRKGQATERFTKALERLESDGEYARLGGVYALERLMLFSPELGPDITEVLVAFIRGNWSAP